MSKKIDGICFKNMVDYAVRNLKQHVKAVNRLNVFPVPDGDTGTNMVTTIQKALQAVGESAKDLPSVSRRFAHSVVFEARGNSGVIVSQFLKGMAERFYDVDAADGALFIEALEKGVEYAYAAVATPVEGTMLTVVKDATAAVKKEYFPAQTVGEIIDSFVEHAKRSLENTPELLAVLKESGVVDSGGAGIVYLFEGMKKYLRGEALEAVESENEAPSANYDAFDRNSSFPYGYCTELLIQLLNEKEAVRGDELRRGLSLLGDSLAMTEEKDKVRVHIHTKNPEEVLSLCHRYGEFLNVKVENMTLQHALRTEHILCSEVKNDGGFAVVAVAGDEGLRRLFLDMGADVVICARDNVSTKDYLDAFAMTNKEEILVFPNSSDAVLSAMQAKKLYQKGRVRVIPSRSIAECYAALPTLDFAESDVEAVADGATAVIGNLYLASVAQRENALFYRDRGIGRNEYYSFSGKELIAVSPSAEEAAWQTLTKVLQEQEREIVTVFYRPQGEALAQMLREKAREAGLTAEFFTVEAESLPCLLTLSFE